MNSSHSSSWLGKLSSKGDAEEYLATLSGAPLVHTVILAEHTAARDNHPLKSSVIKAQTGRQRHTNYHAAAIKPFK